MRLRRLLHSVPMAVFILRGAALLAPGRERGEWLAEWQAELWHVRDAHHARGCFHGNAEVTAFCLGAFQDAFWLRWNNPRSIMRRVSRIGSPARCTFSLAVWTAASLLICLCLPSARRAIQPSPYRHADDLVMISRGGYSGAQSPTIRLQDYESWKTTAQHLFTGVAFYQPVRKRVHIARNQFAELSIGRASDNLFDLLNLSVPTEATEPSNPEYTARLILSQAAYRRLWGGDPRIVGRVVRVAGQRALIVGVVSQSSWQLPGHMDAWMLEDEQHLDALPSSSRGFVLAHTRTSGSVDRLDGWRYMTVRREDGGNDRFDCISLAQRAQLPSSILLFTLILAFLSLPATTPLPLGEYPRHSGRLPRATRARRWIFLSIKFALVVPLVHFTSVDVAYGVQGISFTTAQCIQLAISFFGFLFALRWILQDQRKRCPVCLRLLSNPARVGQASQNFLAWNGTELICAGGHGLLHIPELPTSWFSTQRWLYLDPSWSGLFSDAYIASAGLV
jgi:hypothetical protein